MHSSLPGIKLGETKLFSYIEKKKKSQSTFIKNGLFCSCTFSVEVSLVPATDFLLFP